MSAQSTHTAFFYGTLMAPKVLQRVCHGPALPDSTTRNLPNTLHFRSAILPGYRRHRVQGADYPGIVANETAEVRGTLVDGLNDGDIWRLDHFEGDEYARKKVWVRVLRAGDEKEDVPAPMHVGNENLEEKVEAETYVWIAGEDALESREWDFEEFVKEKMWRWVDEGGEDEGEYADLDGAIKAEEGEGHAAVEDPTRGRGKNGAITMGLQESWAASK